MERRIHTSAIAENDAFYASLVETVVDGIVETLGPGSLEAILMIGAPARGEATIISTPDGSYSLSDIDLICVHAPSADRRALAARLGPRILSLNEEIGGVCVGVDASFRTRRELETVQPFISSQEMLASPVVVWGDERVATSLPEPRIDDIPPNESLKLVHNRIVEQLLLYRSVASAPEDYRPVASLLYGTAKLGLDSVTAILYLEKTVPMGYRERVDVFLYDVLERSHVRHLRDRLHAYREDLQAWAAFKATGSLVPISDRFREEQRPPELGRIAREQWYRYTEFAEICWRFVLGEVVRTNLLDAPLDDVVACYAGLETPARSGVRALKRLRPGASPPGLFSPGRVIRRSAFASPRLLAYVTGILAYVAMGDSYDWCTVGPPINAYCPFPLPKGFDELGLAGKREILVDRLSFFHESVLLGRAVGRGDGGSDDA
jgi:hypothetical protein